MVIGSPHALHFVRAKKEKLRHTTKLDWRRTKRHLGQRHMRDFVTGKAYVRITV